MNGKVLFMGNNFWKHELQSDKNFWFGVIFLCLVGYFVPERYSILVYLGFIWMMLFEISDRLRTQYHYYKEIAETMRKLVDKT